MKNVVNLQIREKETNNIVTYVNIDLDCFVDVETIVYIFLSATKDCNKILNNTKKEYIIKTEVWNVNNDFKTDY